MRFFFSLTRGLVVPPPPLVLISVESQLMRVGSWCEVEGTWPLMQRAFRTPAGARVTFSLLAHAAAGAAANSEAGPQGGGQDARSKVKVTKEKWPEIKSSRRD